MTEPKIALVTGAAKRTGRVIAEYFAQQGYHIAVHYHESLDEAEKVANNIRKIGRQAILIKANLSHPDAYNKLIASVYDAWEKLDVLVNCAAIFTQDHFQNFSLETLEAAWQINCKMPILLTRAFYEHARKNNQRGVVINIVDQQVQDNFQRDHFSYTVSKTALGHLTKMLAISAKPILRINAIYPGLLLPSDDQTLQDFEYARQHATPLGYTATPLDIAKAAYHLTLPTYNGVDLIVDAGQNLIPVAQDVIYAHRAQQVY